MQIRLVSLQMQIQEADIAMKRMSELYELDPEQTEADSLIDDFSLSGAVWLENVTFRYGNRSPVLNNVSLRVAPGEKIALVGESGGGKPRRRV